MKKLREKYDSKKKDYGTSEDRDDKVTKSIDKAFSQAEEVLQTVKNAIETYETAVINAK